ncbi:tRNA pseudouridine synthase D [Vibrio ruber DSM 16370]|uniref:tRNA pseudouridine synthase D n=1 Tax=Vibrio ruber (strain DSM 16370 / JCM 11486 / BCRC 17186 / CECT 7878 / LMG 23124 / VR1) TaxID=1123498 RepID=A0A1R4LGJ0_VIBR1|nr:tRNA pseudouridine(13) synthase TruD [Vibrio ruber]SJN55691.1 tRNA pseudouridine synthase D [Vibrio ruber DSM 16370]
MDDVLANLAYLYGKPTAKAKIKAKPEHFIVTEELGFPLDGVGEHLMVRIRKTGENTSFVANELAKACGVKSKDVSWAGLKDRHAVTEQWLSVHLPKGDTPDFADFLTRYPHIKILETTRHLRKLRPGDLRGNHFQITLTEVSDMTDVEQRLNRIGKQAVPNYFGAQRFGHQGNNVNEARRWGRENVRTRNQNQRSLYLSAARSWIFNQIVSERISKGCFHHLIDGDIVLQGNEQFRVEGEEMLAQWQEHVTQCHADISAALAGDNALPTSHEALALEQRFVDDEPDLMKLIRGNRMKHERRNIALKPRQLDWKLGKNEVILSFALDAGCFATSLIRELIEEVPVKREF